MRKSIFAIALIMFYSPGHSQISYRDSALHYTSIGIFGDQDLFVDFLNLDEDRNYTMGVGFFYSSDCLRKSWMTLPIRWISKTLYPKLDPAYQQAERKPFTYALMLANGTFTPDDLRSYDVIPNDRPYGNVTSFQQTVNRVVEDRNGSGKFVKHSASFGIGLIGTQISRIVQSKIHSWFNENDTKPPYTPRGWPHQVSNGGELTFLLTRSSEKLLTTKNVLNDRSSMWFGEIKHGWKYSVGYYTGVEYDVNMRIGLLDPNNWTYDMNPLNDHNKDARSVPWMYQKQTKPEVYLVAGGRPVFMLYNALLNGQFRKSDLTIDFYHTRHIFFQWDLGIAGKIPLGSNAALDLKWRVLSGRTAEFKLPGRDPRTHYWGGFDIVYSHFK